MTRVLIIEDEESYREATAFMLRKEGRTGKLLPQWRRHRPA